MDPSRATRQDCMDEAVARLQRKQLNECLIWVERAVPRLDGLARLVKIAIDEAGEEALARFAEGVKP